MPTGYGTNAVDAQLLNSYLGGWTQRLKNKRGAAVFLNQLDSQIELDYALELFCSRFSWHGDCISHLTDGFIEKTVFVSGFCVGFVHPVVGFTVWGANAITFDYNGEPLDVNAYPFTDGAGTGFTRLTRDEYVILKDNSSFSAPLNVAQRKSNIISDIGRTIEVYVGGLKKPVFIVTNDKNKLTNESIAKQMQDNTPYILASSNDSKGLDIDNAPSLFNSNHNGADLLSLFQAKRSATNELLAKLGVDCNGNAKNQYQSEGEIVKETFHTDILLAQSEKNRKQFCEGVKEKFGLHIYFTNNVQNTRDENNIQRKR